MKTKQAEIAWRSIVQVVLTVIVLILILFFVEQLVSDTINETAADAECRNTFKFAKLTPNEFIIERNGEFIKSTCKTREVEVTEEDVSQAADLILSCWNKVGRGELQLLSQAESNRAMCLYCGAITSESTLSLREPLLNELEAQEEGIFNELTGSYINFNIGTFREEGIVPEEIRVNEPVDVFFYNHRCSSPEGEECRVRWWNRWVDQFRTGPLSSQLATLVTQREHSLSGIFLVDLPDGNPGADNSISFYNQDIQLQCDYLIIPDRIEEDQVE